jgi:hypothetical protein
MREGKSHRRHKAVISEVIVLYLESNSQWCGSGAFEHYWGPFRWTEQNVCPYERALESGIAPGPAYVAYLKARWGAVNIHVVGALGLMYEDENVCEEDVGKTRDGGEGVAIGLEGASMTGVV